MYQIKHFSDKNLFYFIVALTLVCSFAIGIVVGKQVIVEFDIRSFENTALVKGPHFPYTLDQPVYKHLLPDILREVSAVSYVDDTHVAMVQDELGTVFFLSTISGKIVREIKFAKKGDYEGLAILGDEAWVLKSNGNLYEITGLNQPILNVQLVKTILTSRDDTEGLVYDAVGNQLLIGLKEPPTLFRELREDKRAVFSFDLRDKTLSDTPYLLLDMKMIKKVYDNQTGSYKKDLLHFGQEFIFKPSDLAIHPITGHIYHIAAAGQLLVVSDSSGLIYYVRKLPKEIFKQPEGITFDPHGNMIISSEGVDSKGLLLKFQYQPAPIKQEEPVQATSLLNF